VSLGQNEKECLTSAGLPDFPASIFAGFAGEIRKGELAVESNDDALQQLVDQVRSQVK
jgi:hypothetical protein